MNGAGHDSRQFSELARDLAGAADEAARLRLAVEAAVALVERCDHAGFTVNDKMGDVITVANSDEVVKRANELQGQLREGPSGPDG